MPKNEEAQQNNIQKEYLKKLKQHRYTIRLIAISVIVIAILIAVGVKLYLDNKVFKSYQVEKKITVENTTGCDYYEFGSYMLKYSSDGLSYVRGKSTVWNQAFEMKEPIIEICENCVAIAEANSNQVYIYDTKGEQGTIHTTYPIVDLSVSKQGIVAAITEDGDANYIELMDKEGTQLVTGRTVADGNGYPLDVSLSNDGTKMIVSYLQINQKSPQNSVAFYNFTEIGKGEIDRLVGGFNQYKDSIVPKVEFINNTTACAFGDKMFTIYHMKQKPSIVHEETFEKNVKSVFYSRRYIGIVLRNEGEKKPYKLKIYNTKGDVLLNKSFDMEYQDIKFAGDNVLMYNEKTCKIISIAGVTKFDYEFAEGIIDIIPREDNYKYILINGSGIQEIQLQ